MPYNINKDRQSDALQFVWNDESWRSIRSKAGHNLSSIINTRQPTLVQIWSLILLKYKPSVKMQTWKSNPPQKADIRFFHLLTILLCSEFCVPLRRQTFLIIARSQRSVCIVLLCHLHFQCSPHYRFHYQHFHCLLMASLVSTLGAVEFSQSHFDIPLLRLGFQHQESILPYDLWFTVTTMLIE